MIAFVHGSDTNTMVNICFSCGEKIHSDKNRVTDEFLDRNGKKFVMFVHRKCCDIDRLNTIDLFDALRKDEKSDN